MSYDTPPEKLKQIPGIVQDIVMKQPKTRFDRCHLLTLSDWALRYETVFFMTVADYSVYADAQQTINIEVVDALRKLGVDIAFPYAPPAKPEPAGVESPANVSRSPGTA